MFFSCLIRRNNPIQSRSASTSPLLTSRGILCEFRHRDGPSQSRQGIRLYQPRADEVFQSKHLKVHRTLPLIFERPRDFGPRCKTGQSMIDAIQTEFHQIFGGNDTSCRTVHLFVQKAQQYGILDHCHRLEVTCTSSGAAETAKDGRPDPSFAAWPERLRKMERIQGEFKIRA